MVSAFAQTLRRYTSLNHLAQAARAVLQNTSQINQMLSDLNRVDFANVQVNLSENFMSRRQTSSCTRLVYVDSLCVFHLWLCVAVSCWMCLDVFVVSYRSRRPGCVSVTRVWFSAWSRTSRSLCSSRALWTNGPPGWTMWSLRSWSLTRVAPASPKLHASSCSNGPFIGTRGEQWGCVLIKSLVYFLN